jgi:hypothetical protein
MTQEVEPKVLLFMYAVYIHIQGGFEAPPEPYYKSRTLIQRYSYQKFMEGRRRAQHNT